MDTVEYNLKKKIFNIIKKRIKFIVDGYEVINSEPDGCDEFGIKYWVYCKNGYSSRSWNVPYDKRKHINKFYVQIFKEGIFYGDNIYYLKPTSNIEKIKDIQLIDYIEHIKYIEKLKLYTSFFKECISIINSNLPYYCRKDYNYEFLYDIEKLRTHVNILLEQYKNNNEIIKKINDLSYQKNINLNFLE